MVSTALWGCALVPALLMGMSAAAAVSSNVRGRALARAASTLGFASFLVCLGSSIALWQQVPLWTRTLGVQGLGASLYFDRLTAVVWVLVAFVGAIVLRYSVQYMDGDAGQRRFTQWLSFTLGAVLLLIISGNGLLLLLAWIAVSAGLHRLLLFFPERVAAVLAARKKFVASRIGDACLIIALVLIYRRFGSLDLHTVFGQLAGGHEAQPQLVGLAAACIACAALLKSAQFPLHGWLTEVMETPTPVSALLHAGVINAGGFLVLRLAPLISTSPISLDLLAVIGGMTALFGSMVMLTQTSVKSSLAYSTVAQMGFMMLECGLGAFTAALLHIVAHSLYKAHAFLSSGSIMDLARASWSPSPGGRPHPARLWLAVVAILAIAAAVGATFGATIRTEPGVFALGAILMLGLLHLIANAIDEKPSPYVLGRALLSAVFVAAAYFTLQRGTALLVGDSLPRVEPLRGLFDLALVLLVVVSFAAVTVLQNTLPRKLGSGRWQTFYVHLSNGFYANALANQLVVRYWPRRTMLPPNPAR